MKVVNIGNIAEAYICDDLPAMGIVIEATLDELERLPNLTYKEVTISAPPRNCDLARDWMRDLYAHFQPPASVKREMPPEWVDAVMAFCRWLVAPATEKEGGNK